MAKSKNESNNKNSGTLLTEKDGTQYFVMVHRILSGHCIDNQDGLMNFHSFLDLLKLCHHIFIYMKTSCSIKDHNIVTILCCMLNCCLRNIRRLILVSHGEHLYALLLCVDLQLLNCSRTVNITCYQKWFLTF